MSVLINELSQSLQLDPKYLRNLINNSDHYYKVYYIKKANGGKRRISHPSPEIKTLQYWCAKEIFSLCKISTAAYAYRENMSIKMNANIHRQSNHILHLDIKNFFESINGYHIERIIEDNQTSLSKLHFDISQSIDDLKKICLRNNCMCIGSVSSPIISNCVLYNFDVRMIEYAESEGFVYSRYADDIYLSSKRFIDNGAFRFVDAMLHQQGFIINQSKTRYMSNKNRKMVTGLILTDDHRVSVGLDMRRQVKDMLYKMMTRHEGDAAVVQGYLAFIKDIEPHTYNKLIIKYSKYGNVKDILSK